MTTDSTATKKARGAFFTPPDLVAFLTDWAVRAPSDLVLEPSCGEASFLLAAGTRLRSLGGYGADQLQGVEIHAESARQALRELTRRGLPSTIVISDFFDSRPGREFDAVIGNPPFIRYQQFGGTARTKAQFAALAEGVKLSGLASSWAAFVVHASAHLKPGGRLALVLPAELLSVNYAGPVRRFLMERFGRVRTVVFDNRVFPGVLEEVVLLMAEGAGSTDHIQLVQAGDLENLDTLAVRKWYPPQRHSKWTPALVPTDAFNLYTSLLEGNPFVNLVDWGDTTLGMVTGNNEYFTLSREQALGLELAEEELVAISPASSRHLRGLSFTSQKWQKLADQGAKVYLLRPSNGSLSAGASRYVKEGELAGVQTAYKCRMRDPWWRVPRVPRPDLFFTYMNYSAPQLVANEAKVDHLNSVHGVNLKPQYRRVGMDILPLAALNTLTILGAELVGRSYGGGILKMEPKEADALPVPSPNTLVCAQASLRKIRPCVDAHLAAGEFDLAVALVDKALWVEHLGVSKSQVQSLATARRALFLRRAVRGRSA